MHAVSQGTFGRWVGRVLVVVLVLYGASRIGLARAQSTDTPDPARPQAEALAGPATPSGLWLTMALDDAVAFSGQISPDVGGVNERGGNMMYPAPGLAGFLAAVATHGVLNNIDAERKKTQQRDNANKVLVGYQPMLGQFRNRELATTSLALMTRPGRKQLSANGSVAPGEIVIESLPQFLLTGDQRALILDNVITIKPDSTQAPYRTQIRIVSDAIGEDGPQKAWTDNDGRKLKDESAHLLAVSFELALDGMQASGKDSGPQKTLRYQEGGKEKIARGQLVREDCARIYFRSLRDELISAPKSVNTCAQPDQPGQAGALAVVTPAAK